MPGMWQKTMVYLGLKDDDEGYEYDYDGYELDDDEPADARVDARGRADRAPGARTAVASRPRRSSGSSPGCARSRVEPTPRRDCRVPTIRPMPATLGPGARRRAGTASTTRRRSGTGSRPISP